MQKRTRNVLIWLALIFVGGVVAVVVIGMIASKRDTAAAQRVRTMGRKAVERYEEQFPAEQTPGKASREAPRNTTRNTTAPPSSIAPQLFTGLGDTLSRLESQQPDEIKTLLDDKPRSEWDDGDYEMLAEYLAQHADLLENIRRLAELGEPVFHADLSEGYAVELPHLAQLRAMARLLRDDAAVRARAGDLAGAIENYSAIAGLGETVAGEPIIISQLVRIAMDGILFQGLADSLPPGQLSPEETRAFVDEIAGIYHREAMGIALVSEAAFGMDAMDDVRDGDFPLPINNPVLSFVYQTPIGDVMISADQQDYAEFMERLTAAAQLPYYEACAELDAIEADVEDLSMLSVLTQALVPALTRVQRAQARNEAVLDIMRIGLLLEAHHAETGSYPETLNAVAFDLGGTVPVDPFTGESYVYIPEGDTFTLYSVGENEQDDGGGRFDYHEGDIVWRGVKEPND